MEYCYILESNYPKFQYLNRGLYNNYIVEKEKTRTTTVLFVEVQQVPPVFIVPAKTFARRSQYDWDDFLFLLLYTCIKAEYRCTSTTSGRQKQNCNPALVKYNQKKKKNIIIINYFATQVQVVYKC
jgi:hypothetical protein